MFYTRLLKRYTLFTIVIVGISLFALLGNVIYDLYHINNANIYSVLRQSLYVIVLGMIQFILLYTFIKKKPFYISIDRVLIVLSVIILIYSFLLPKFSEHIQFVSFKILHNNQGYIIDGWYLLAALLVFLFSRIIHYGVDLQKEVDDIV